MQIIIINSPLSNTTLEELKSRTDTNILPCFGYEECIGMLDLLPDIDGIIFGDEDLADIREDIENDKLKADFIYIGSENLNNPSIRFYKVEDEKNLSERLEKLVGRVVSADSDSEKYTQIPKDCFKSLDDCPVDFYLRLKRGENYNYIKYFHKDDKVDHNKIKEQADKGLNDYYIKTTELTVLNNKLAEIYKNILNEKNQSGEILEKDTISQIFSQLNSIGFNEETCVIAHKTVENMVNNFNSNLLKEIKAIFKNEESFKFKKGMMTSILATSLAKDLDWITPASAEAINMCAFFCDKFLPEDEMSMISSDYELETSKYQNKDAELVKKHALLCSDWMASFDNIPNEAPRLIKQHHGSVGGIGLPTNLAPQITNISLLYIVLESFSYEVLSTSGGKLSLKKVLDNIKNKYDNQKINAYVDILSEHIKKQKE